MRVPDEEENVPIYRLTPACLISCTACHYYAKGSGEIENIQKQKSRMKLKQQV